jgi:hypothetical protein
MEVVELVTEIWKEGVLLLISVIVGTAVFLMYQPKVSELEDMLGSGGREALLKEFSDVLALPGDVRATIHVVKRGQWYMNYEAGKAKIYFLNSGLERDIWLGAYDFVIDRDVTLYFDGRGWRPVG